MRPYGELKLVEIADTPDEFIEAAEKILSKSNRGPNGWPESTRFCENISWDKTWAQMSELIDEVIERTTACTLGLYAARIASAHERAQPYQLRTQ